MQNPQDPRVERTKWPEAASNALLDATSKEALEKWPEIIVIPKTEQMPQIDNLNVLEIPAEDVSPKDLPEQIVI